MENYLAETFGWTLDEIKRVPYKWIQRHALIKKMENDAHATKSEIEKFKSQSRSGGPRYREV
jgi:hypothetical protein